MLTWHFHGEGQNKEMPQPSGSPCASGSRNVPHLASEAPPCRSSGSHSLLLSSKSKRRPDPLLGGRCSSRRSRPREIRHRPKEAREASPGSVILDGILGQEVINGETGDIQGKAGVG